MYNYVFFFNIDSYMAKKVAYEGVTSYAAIATLLT